VSAPYVETSASMTDRTYALVSVLDGPHEVTTLAMLAFVQSSCLRSERMM